MNFIQRLLYTLVILAYEGGMYLIASFYTKARKIKSGRKNNPRAFPPPQKFRVWFHCASAGEFEQARTVIEMLKEKSAVEIMLSFFSSSGMELHSTYPHADCIFYLPADTPWQANSIVKQVDARLVVLVKYEFWLNWLHELQKKKTPVMLISARFRENQIFFRWYGSWFRAALLNMKQIFVQDERSKELLSKSGIHHTTVAGDTRFDRVIQLPGQPWSNSAIEQFCDEKKIMVAGSTWPDDDELLLAWLEQYNQEYKLILVPHEIHPSHLQKLALLHHADLFSELTNRRTDSRILLIDQKGILGKLYRYATTAYVGGGFNNGIHNILEAAVYNIPVLFGPKFSKSGEAVELLSIGMGASVKTAGQLESMIQQFSSSPQQPATWVKNNSGATRQVTDYILKTISGIGA